MYHEYSEESGKFACAQITVKDFKKGLYYFFCFLVMFYPQKLLPG